MAGVNFTFDERAAKPARTPGVFNSIPGPISVRGAAHAAAQTWLVTAAKWPLSTPRRPIPSHCRCLPPKNMGRPPYTAFQPNISLVLKSRYSNNAPGRAQQQSWPVARKGTEKHTHTQIYIPEENDQ